MSEVLGKLGPLESRFFGFVDLLGARSENWVMLNSLVWTEANALLQLLYSIQNGSHETRNLALRRMIGNFFAFDR